MTQLQYLRQSVLSTAPGDLDPAESGGGTTNRLVGAPPKTDDQQGSNDWSAV